VTVSNAVIRRSKDHRSYKSERRTSLKLLEEKSDLWKANEKLTFIPLPPEINTPNHEYWGAGPLMERN
jgi:hypothetical protein